MTSTTFSATNQNKIPAYIAIRTRESQVKIIAITALKQRWNEYVIEGNGKRVMQCIAQYHEDIKTLSLEEQRLHCDLCYVKDVDWTKQLQEIQ